MLKKCLALILVLVFISLPASLYAQLPVEKPDASSAPTGQLSGLPLDLLPPGARALGLGGAFTAVADDATAALANPGGLTNLTAPEVSLFIRYTDADVNYLDPDAYDSGRFYNAGDLDKVYNDSTTDISYASFVYPFERFVISGFYSNQLDFTGVQIEDGVRWDNQVRNDPEFGDFAYFDRYTNFNSVKATVENLGISGAWRINDTFSIGLTLRRSELDLQSQDSYTLEYWRDLEFLAAIESGGDVPSIEDVEQALGVVNDFYDYNTQINDSDSDLAYDLGLYYKGEQWSFGLVYHSGSTFSLSTLATVDSELSCVGDSDQADTCRTFIDLLGGEQSINESLQTANEVELPGVVSLGVAWRPADTWLLSLDINYVDYSALNGPRNTTLGFGTDINDVAARSGFNDPQIRNLQGPLSEPISDEYEFRFGVEKSFVFQGDALRSLALRGGAFTVEDHDGIAMRDSSETVWTLGLGTAWGKNEIGATQFLLDLGAGFADDTTNIVLSGMVRF